MARATIVRTNTIKLRPTGNKTPVEAPLPKPKAILPKVEGYTFIGYTTSVIFYGWFDLIIGNLVFRRNDILKWFDIETIHYNTTITQPPANTHIRVFSPTARTTLRGYPPKVVIDKVAFISMLYDTTKMFMKLVNGKVVGVFDEYNNPIECSIKDMFYSMGHIEPKVEEAV